MGFWNRQDTTEEAQAKKDTKTFGFFGDAANVVGGLATGVAESLYKPIEVMGKGLGNAVGEFSGVNQQIQDSANKSVDTNNATLEILRRKLKQEKDPIRQKQIQTSIANITKQNSDVLATTQQTFDEAQAATDPGHIANNAAQLAINVASMGAAGNVARGTVAGSSKLGTALRAITNPASIKEGSIAFGAMGAAQGGLMTADTPGATMQDVAQSAVIGGVAGGVLGAGAGWLGGKTASKVATQELNSIDNVAKTTSQSAYLVDNAPQGLVVNGEVPTGTTTQLSPQNVNNVAGSDTAVAQVPLNNEFVPQSGLARAAQMENPAMASVPPTITPVAKSTAVDPMIEAIAKDNANIAEFNRIRKEFGDDNKMYDMLQNQYGGKGFLSEAAQYVGSQHEGKGVPLKDLMDEIGTPIPSMKQTKALNLSDSLTALKSDIRKLEKSTGQKGLYSQVSNAMKDMSEQEQVDFMGKAMMKMRDEGVLAKDAINRANSYKPTPKPETPTPQVSKTPKVSLHEEALKHKTPEDFVKSQRALESSDKLKVGGFNGLEKITQSDMKDIIATHRKRFGDSNVQLGGDDIPHTIGSYKYENDMINLVEGKANMDTFDHESVHKAIGQFLPDSDIEALYKDIVKLKGGKNGLSKKYRNNGYPGISWRGAAEEEIANTFNDFMLLKGQLMGEVNPVYELAQWADNKGISYKIVEVLLKLSKSIEKHFGKYTKRGAESRLEAFYSKIESGDLASAMRRESKYVEPVSVIGRAATKTKELLGDTYLNVAKELPGNKVFDNALAFRYGKSAAQKSISTRKLRVMTNEELTNIWYEAHGTTPRTSLAKTAKNIGAEITPGQDKLVADITMTDDQVKQAVADMGGIKIKEKNKVASLKSLGATDQQLRDIVGVDSFGTKVKEMKVKNTIPEPEVVAPKGSLGEQIGVNIKDRAGNASPEIQQASAKLGAVTDDIAEMLTGPYRSAPTKIQKLLKGFTEGVDNVTNNMSRMAGKVGADISDKLQAGATWKTKFIDETKQYVDSVKDFSVEKLGVAEAKAQVGRIRDAIEKVDTSVLKPGDQPAFDAAKALFDRTKNEMVKRGRGVKENYFTHATLESDDNATGRVLDAIFGGESDPMSVFSKKRVGDTAGEVADMKTLLAKYQQGMANDLAYTDAFKYLSSNLKEIPAHLANDAANMSAFRDYTSNLFKHARSGGNETELSRLIGKPFDAFTDNVLRFNISNAFKNPTDRFKINSLLSPEAKAIKIDKGILKNSIESRHFNFGNSKISETGQGPTRLSKIGQAFDKISPNTATEKLGVNYNWDRGLAEGFSRSPVYKQAKASGMSELAAQTKAIAEDAEGVYRTANWVSGTASAGNPMQQMGTLRNGKPLLGGLIPFKSITRFASYPLTNMAQFARNMKPKVARVIESYARGDIMGAANADIRGGAATIIDMMENLAKDPGSKIPKDVMALKIKIAKDALDVIDTELAKGSQISIKNNAATFAKVWGATTAVQLAVVGAQDAVFNRKGSDARQRSVLGTALMQSPFLDVSRAINPVINPLFTTSYGVPSVNAGGALNAIPYAGSIDSVTGGNMAKWLNTNVGKSTNRTIRGAFE